MKRLALIAMVAALGFSVPVSAEDAKTSIAVVNMQVIMRESTSAKSVREQLESKQKSFYADMTKKEEALQKEDQELGKQQSVLSKEAFAEKRKAFVSKATEMQKEVQTKKSLLDAGLERSQNDILKAVNEIITGLAKEKRYTMVIQASPLLYADENLDVTKEVLDRLNKKLPKVDVKFDSK
jgi:outer membrane protein